MRKTGVQQRALHPLALKAVGISLDATGPCDWLQAVQTCRHHMLYIQAGLLDACFSCFRLRNWCSIAYLADVSLRK